MDRSDQLRRLIEIAWENGWKHRPENPANSVSVDGNLVQFVNHGPMWDDSEGYRTTESILFDPEFIRALCRAKYGEDTTLIDRQLSQLPFDWKQAMLGLDWSDFHLCQLAIAGDRIGYLADQFLAEGEKKEQQV